MKTVLTDSTEIAAEFIKNGGTAAFPTETVYGLGANIFDEIAIRKIFGAKGRPSDNPLIAHVGNLEQIRLLASEITESAAKFIEAFFPAPLTLVLPKSARVPFAATANLDTIGVRMPDHETALEFLKFCETPVAAPSANLSGKPSPTTWRAVFEDLDGRIDCILKGEITKIGIESTVVDCAGEIPVVLRTGAITLEQLQAVNFRTRLYIAEIDGGEAKSPGLKHKHYSPRARVVLIKDVGGQKGIIENAGFIGLREPYEPFELEKICQSVEEYAHSLYDFFRQCDRMNLEMIFCQTVEEKGIGLALMDRLRRAAEN